MSQSVPRFDFYEKVIINTQASEKTKVDGIVGTILGRVHTENGKGWYYTVFIDLTETCWCFFESELSATGEKSRREDFYDGSTVRVNTDVKGKGRINSNCD